MKVEKRKRSYEAVAAIAKRLGLGFVNNNRSNNVLQGKVVPGYLKSISKMGSTKAEKQEASSKKPFYNSYKKRYRSP